MLKKKFFFIYIMLVVPIMINAGNYPDKGLYGKLSYTYTENDYLNNTTKYYTEQATQAYMIGYAGNIYSPRLFDYTLTGKIRYDDSKTMNSNSEASSVKTDSQDFSINMRIIKDSDFPFTINLAKQNSVVEDSVYTIEQKSISGKMKFDPLNFTYGVSNSSRVSENGNTIGVSEYNNYNAGLNYSEDAHVINIMYYHTEQTFNQKYKDYNLTTYSEDLVVDDRLNINYRWKISKELNLDSSVSYESDSYASLESINTNIKLNWNPNIKYGGSIYVDASRYEYINSENDSKDIIDILNINQNFRYKITDSLAMNEYMSITTFNGSNSKGTSATINLSANHNYSRNIFNKAKLRVSTVASTEQSQIKTISEDKTNTKNNGSYTFSTSANVSRPLESISSILNLNASCNYNLQTTENTNNLNQIYSAGSSLSSNFSIFRNNLNVNVYKSDSDETSMISTTVSDTINTNARLGIRGKINFKVGAKYYTYKRENSSIKRTSLDVSTNLQYRFFTRLLFNMSSNVRHDIETDYIAYSGNSGLSYLAGKTSLSIKYMYNRSESNSFDNNEANIYERTSLRFNIERRF